MPDTYLTKLHISEILSGEATATLDEYLTLMSLIQYGVTHKEQYCNWLTDLELVVLWAENVYDDDSVLTHIDTEFKDIES